MADYTNDFPWLTPGEPPQTENNGKRRRQRGERKCSLTTLISTVCIVVMISVILTYTLTAASVRSLYVSDLQKKEQTIQALNERLQAGIGTDKTAFGSLDFLSWMIGEVSYYADEISEEERLNMVMKAYVSATGDLYAEYYTQEEYDAFLASNRGEQVGIGITYTNINIELDGEIYQAFEVLSVYRNSPAEHAGVRPGDVIVLLGQEDGNYYTLEELGGFSAAVRFFRGEVGTVINFAVVRGDETDYEVLEFAIARDYFEAESVGYSFLEEDRKVGVIHLYNFDLTTPTQLKASMNALLDGGAEYFVLDLRSNPGGDIKSVSSVLSYFLQEGDLVIDLIDRNGVKAESIYATVTNYTGDYVGCNVAKEEIGMYSDLPFVVLCNTASASAAEIFVDSMRAHGLATVVGETTYGKGVMQHYFSLSSISYGVYEGYVKLTTYAFVTQSGESFHGIGITPDVVVELPDEAYNYTLYTLPYALDTQMQAAVAQFQR